MTHLKTLSHPPRTASAPVDTIDTITEGKFASKENIVNSKVGGL